MRTEAQNRASEKYRLKTYDSILIQCRKEYNLNERIKAAAQSQGISKQAYIIEAIEKQLALDGYGKQP